MALQGVGASSVGVQQSSDAPKTRATEFNDRLWKMLGRGLQSKPEGEAELRALWAKLSPDEKASIRGGTLSNGTEIIGGYWGGNPDAEMVFAKLDAAPTEKKSGSAWGPK